MVWEILLASVLLALGIMVIYFSVEKGIKSEYLLLYIFVGIVFILAGSWLLIEKLTLALIVRKLGGLFLAAFGLFLVVGFPGVVDYQREGMGRAGIFIGLIIFFIGIYLLLF